MSINKENLRSLITAVIIFSMFLFFAAFNHAIASEKYEEGEDTVLSSDEYLEGADTDISYDNVITGTMDAFSQSMIIVDGARHSLCKDVMVFNMANILIKLNDIEAALQVKLFQKSGCVSKINVLTFGQ